MINGGEIFKGNTVEDRASAIVLGENSLQTIKTSGVLWMQTEAFSFNYSLAPNMERTKQRGLKQTTSIYGFLAPYCQDDRKYGA